MQAEVFYSAHRGVFGGESGSVGHRATGTGHFRHVDAFAAGKIRGQGFAVVAQAFGVGRGVFCEEQQWGGAAVRARVGVLYVLGKAAEVR